MNAEFIQGELSKFNVADAVIAEMKAEFTALKIDGIKDSKGYKAVHTALMTVKGKRVEVEKKRKELKADSLAFGRAVDTEAKRITALLKPIEDYLAAEKQAVLDEKARLKAEAERQEAERKARERAELEAKLRAEAEAKAAEEKARLEAEAKAEAKRLAQVEAEQEAERKRLEAIAQEQARKEAELRAEQEQARLALAEERRAIQAEKERLAALSREAEEQEQAEAPALEVEPVTLPTFMDEPTPSGIEDEAPTLSITPDIEGEPEQARAEPAGDTGQDLLAVLVEALTLCVAELEDLQGLVEVSPSVLDTACEALRQAQEVAA
jgi:hypothetical protein